LIVDHGQGIKPENLSTLFNPGTKYTTLGTAGETGNGLGLSFSYEMMIRNNGNIQAESTFGEGTTFFLTLPTVKPKNPGRCKFAEEAFSMN
jgi:signal transduction histidine kinase